MIGVQNLYKIYGSSPSRALQMLDNGASKEDIRKETDQVVGVNDANFTLEPKEMFVVMGLSGSGKSTLLRCVNRLINPTKGKIFLDLGDGESTEVTSLNQDELLEVRREKISMVFQHFALLPYRTVLENAAFGLKIRNQSESERRRKAREVLEIVGLDKWCDSKPSELSGGMRQRVGLARALATDSPILLMDEPFSALDPLIRFNMQDELLRIQNEFRKTILFITHDLGEALRIGNRIAVMNNGEIIQIDTPEKIVTSPQTDYVSRFVKNADPTEVITAKELIKSKVSQFESSEVFEEEFADGRTIKVFLTEEKKVWRCEVDGMEVPWKPPFGEEELNVIYTVTKTTTLKEVINEKKNSPFPLVVVSEDGTFSGIIKEEDIFKGILKEN